MTITRDLILVGTTNGYIDNSHGLHGEPRCAVWNFPPTRACAIAWLAANGIEVLPVNGTVEGANFSSPGVFPNGAVFPNGDGWIARISIRGHIT